MFTTLADVPHVGLALGVVGLALFGVVVDLPTEPVPDANAVAETIDRVAASTHPTMATHPLEATAVKLSSSGVALRSDGGASHAAFAYGPVTPVGDAGPLRRVLLGAPPESAFASPTDLRRAASEAREEQARWRDADGELHARHLSWGTVDVTLVGA